MRKVITIIKTKKYHDKLWMVCVGFIYFMALELIGQVIIYQTNELGGKLGSDLIEHIRLAVEGTNTYSLLSGVYIALDFIFRNQISVAIFLICLIFSGILAGAWYLKKVSNTNNVYLCLLISLCAYCSAAIYLPCFNPDRYKGLLMSGIWHNSTTFAIKFIGIFQIYVFQKIAERFRKKHSIDVTELICFSVLGVISAGLKPNLDLALYPALAVILGIWCIQNNGRFLKELLLIAVTVLPTFFVLFIQSNILFNNSTSSFAVAPFYIIKLYVDNIPISIFQSFAFPIAVLMLAWNRFKKLDSYTFVWIASIIAYMQSVLFVETGIRKEAGNWLWGILVMMFFLFLINAEYLISNAKILWNGGGWKKIWLIVSGCFFVIHTYYGIEYLYYYLKTGIYFC